MPLHVSESLNTFLRHFRLPPLSNKTELHYSNCAAKLRSKCFVWCPTRMRCSKRKSTKKKRGASKGLNWWPESVFLIITILLVTAHSHLVLSQMTLHHWKAELNTFPTVYYCLWKSDTVDLSYDSLYSDICTWYYCVGSRARCLVIRGSGTLYRARYLVIREVPHYVKLSNFTLVGGETREFASLHSTYGKLST